MQILITGGAGFIGANLASRLASDGATVRILDDLSTGSLRNLEGIDADFREGTILDERVLIDSVQGCDAVIHLAAIPSVPRSVAAPMPTHHANATGTLRVLVAAQSVGAHVSAASSSSVYGANPQLPKTETMVARPQSPYAVSKLAAESYVLAWRMTYGLPTIAFRFFNVYGPLQAPGHAYAAVIPSFVDSALRSHPLTVHGDGLQTRDFTYVDSVTRILADTASRRVVCDRPVNLAFGSRRSLLAVADELEECLGYSVEREHVEPRLGDVRDSQADTRLLRSLFPDAEETPFKQGLAATVAWHQQRLAASESGIGR